jgi:hypothetical protein
MGRSGDVTWMDGDLNGDGRVSPADYAIVSANLAVGVGVAQTQQPGVFGPETTVPEPSTLGVLACAGIMLLRRCRTV